MAHKSGFDFQRNLAANFFSNRPLLTMTLVARSKNSRSRSIGSGWSFLIKKCSTFDYYLMRCMRLQGKLQEIAWDGKKKSVNSF